MFRLPPPPPPGFCDMSFGKAAYSITLCPSPHPNSLGLPSGLTAFDKASCKLEVSHKRSSFGRSQNERQRWKANLLWSMERGTSKSPPLPCNHRSGSPPHMTCFRAECCHTIEPAHTGGGKKNLKAKQTTFAIWKKPDASSTTQPECKLKEREDKFTPSPLFCPESNSSTAVRDIQ